MNLHRTAFRVTVIVSLLTLAVIPMLSCEQPTDAPPPATVDPMRRLAKLQARCWSLRMDWHFEAGWTVTTKQDVGGVAPTKTTRVEADTLDEALRKAGAE